MKATIDSYDVKVKDISVDEFGSDICMSEVEITDSDSVSFVGISQFCWHT
jgi:hypothetical protein